MKISPLREKRQKTGLHLGCGTVYLESNDDIKWINVDVKGSYTYLASNRPDIVAVNKTTRDNYYKEHVAPIDFMSKVFHEKPKVVDMFANIAEMPAIYKADVDHILCVQVLEHFSKEEGFNMLKKWISYLRKGGALEIDVPDMQGTIDIWNNAKSDVEREWALRLIFGSQKNQWSVHKHMYTVDSLTKVFDELGLEDIGITTDIKHTYPAFSLIGYKK